MFVCLFDRYLCPPRRLQIRTCDFLYNIMRFQGEINEIFKLQPDKARGHEIGY